MTTQDFAKSRLFTPLGIKDLYWEQDASGNAIGGWGLELTARDMAKFGYLYLHNGVWEDKQIIPSEWVSQSAQMWVKSSDKWGYGYQWWVKPITRTISAQGLHGQQIYVIPDQDMVIVVTAGKDDGTVLGDLVYNTAISAIR
jgi:CubicO group peptidase (beta-lactamase class C family)